MCTAEAQETMKYSYHKSRTKVHGTNDVETVRDRKQEKSQRIEDDKSKELSDMFYRSMRNYEI